jgi:hypothetical protein
MGLVYGVGIYEKGRHLASINNRLTKPYKLWSSMLHRCYSPLSLELKPTYEAVTVEGDFLEFQLFGDWLDIHYVDGWSLDKDILIPGNKVYRSDRCCMVPMLINTQLNHNRVSRGKWPTGVTYCRRGKRFLAKISQDGQTVNIGQYGSPEDARAAYLLAKRAYLIDLAERYKGQLAAPVYEAIIKFPIEEDFHGVA